MPKKKLHHIGREQLSQYQNQNAEAKNIFRVLPGARQGNNPMVQQKKEERHDFGHAVPIKRFFGGRAHSLLAWGLKDGDYSAARLNSSVSRMGS